jgi:hypothetical protein
MDYYLYNAADGNVYSDLRSMHWSGQIAGMGREYYALNTSATVPDLRSSDTNRNFRASDFFIHDGSYMRLKQLTLNYAIPTNFISKWHLKQSVPIAYSLQSADLYQLSRT